MANPSTTAIGARRRWPRYRELRGVGLMIIVIILVVALSVPLVIHRVNVSPRLLGPYLERRASGHNALVVWTGRTAVRVLRWLDRGDLSPRAEFPPWAPSPAVTTTLQPFTRKVLITDATQLPSALVDARPGDALVFAPGTYRFSGRAITVNRPGRADAPVAMRTERPGTVTLEFALLEGFHVSAPHWIFENLTVVGVCTVHSECEHAFHVVGGATNIVIRNNELRDFNAHIKVNGRGGRFPDNGRIEGNRIFNSTVRRTSAPVTPIDLVAVHNWRIEGNLIADFVKAGGDFTSYGGFAKGGGEGNVFARNVVLCEHRLRGHDGGKGRRIGLSFGGGSTDPLVCRDARCAVEHEGGVMQNNLIASCSDNGIYLNRAARTQLVHNTLIDTAGINVRFGESAAQLVGNWLDGPVAARDGGTLTEQDNHSARLLSSYLGLARRHSPFAAAEALDLRWSGTPRRGHALPDAGLDLCGTTRPARPALGAFENIEPCSISHGRTR